MPKGAGTYGSKKGRPRKKVKKRKIESGLRSAKGGQASEIRGASREGMIVTGSQHPDPGAWRRTHHGEKAKSRIKTKSGLSRKEMLQSSDPLIRSIPAAQDAAIKKRAAKKKKEAAKKKAVARANATKQTAAKTPIDPALKKSIAAAVKRGLAAKKKHQAANRKPKVDSRQRNVNISATARAGSPSGRRPSKPEKKYDYN